MFPGHSQYLEGEFAPVRGGEHDWHVWCATGALRVLGDQEYVHKITADPKAAFTINFANGSAARIGSGHPLWVALASIASSYKVEVYSLSFDGGYVPWTGSPKSLRAFDAICISAK